MVPVASLLNKGCTVTGGNGPEAAHSAPLSLLEKDSKADPDIFADG